MQIPQLPERLIDFLTAARASVGRLQSLDRVKNRFDFEMRSGKVAPNSLKAMRVELNCHSNAIEGNTPCLRETQLVIEGISPPGGKMLHEIYEARNHDEAFRIVEIELAERPPLCTLIPQDLLDIHKAVLRDIAPTAGGLRAAGCSSRAHHSSRPEITVSKNSSPVCWSWHP